jgi:hypothetical protein
MGMGKQEKIDGGRIETKVVSVVLFQFPIPLEEAAVNQNPGAGTFKEMAGTGHISCGTMEGNIHRAPPCP